MSTSPERLFKILAEDGRTRHGGTGVWPLPKNGQPGEWVSVQGKLIPCENGLHLCRAGDLLDWLGPTIWEAEAGGECVDGGNKLVVRRARLIRRVDTWNERTARLFACDCAERALDVCCNGGWEVEARSRAALVVARRFAEGEATDEEMAAAEDAARAACDRPARGAPTHIAWAAARAAWSAAKGAIRAAAEDAAWNSARVAYAAWDAAQVADRAVQVAQAFEREWQMRRLLAYLDGELP